MAQFTYKARSRSGEVMQGLLESADRAAAMSQLKLSLIHISEPTRPC